METNVDDCTPEALSHLMDRVMDEGANDIHVLHTVMKKGRPGYLIRILTKDPEKFTEILMEETGTLGVRVMPIERFEADRETTEKEITINGKKEKIRVKKSRYGTKPEFEDASRIAKKHKIPLREVLNIIEAQI